MPTSTQIYEHPLIGPSADSSNGHCDSSLLTINATTTMLFPTIELHLDQSRAVIL